MTNIITYRDLDVWIAGMDLVERCYRSTRLFPSEELYGLTNQLRRAAISIPSNVAEGNCRRSTKAYANHVSIALGSHGELETCVEIAYRLGYLDGTERTTLIDLSDRVGQMLNGLFRSLKAKLKARKGR
jgi:four helix bundle protein